MESECRGCLIAVLPGKMLQILNCLSSQYICILSVHLCWHIRTTNVKQPHLAVLQQNEILRGITRQHTKPRLVLDELLSGELNLVCSVRSAERTAPVQHHSL